MRMLDGSTARSIRRAEEFLGSKQSTKPGRYSNPVHPGSNLLREFDGEMLLAEFDGSGKLVDCCGAKASLITYQGKTILDATIRHKVDSANNLQK